MKNLLSKPLLFFVLSFLFSFPILLPYLHKGYFPTHDGEWAVVRASEMVREIKDKQFPPRMSGYLNFGYGYPLFNFAYPFPYYVSTFIHFFHVGYVDSIKLTFAISIVLSAFFMMLASSYLWKNMFAGIISGVLYLYFPYRFVDLFARGSIGETVAFVFFPLLIFFLLKIYRKKSILAIIGGAFTFAALITTHNIMAVYFLLIAAFFIGALWYQGGLKKIYGLLFSLFLGLLLSTFFWFPALFEKHNIILSRIPIADRNLYFVTLPQLLTPHFGYGVPTEKDGFSYYIGWPQTILFILILGVLILILQRKKIQEAAKLQSVFISFIFLTVLFIVMMFSFAAPVWKLPILSEINYPWTLLGPLGFLFSLLSGFLMTQKKWLQITTGLATIAAVLLFLPYAKPEYFVDRGDNFYTSNNDTTTSSDELMPVWVTEKPAATIAEKVTLDKQKGSIENIQYSSKNISFTANLLSQTVIRINTIYYPGWHLFVDNKEADINYKNQNGVMEIAVPSGSHTISDYFSETPLRKISDIVSITTLLGLLITFGFFYKKDLEKNEKT
jgi:hypothetical protein